jgi:hypothetical protein
MHAAISTAVLTPYSTTVSNDSKYLQFGGTLTETLSLKKQHYNVLV